MAKSTKKVHVFERNGEFVAEPPIIELTGVGANPDTLRIVNNTDEDLVWIVSDNSLFTGGQFVEQVLSRKLSSIKNPVNSANFSASATYQLIMVKSGKKAKGNSDPVIIVEN